MILTIDKLRDILTKAVDIIEVISFRESIKFKDYKQLQKVSKAIFQLTYAIITDNDGVLSFKTIIG